MKIQQQSTREGFGKAILKLAQSNPNIVVTCADLKDSLKLTDFVQKYPRRYIELGVAEQNLASVSAGLAQSGKIPFMCSYAVFSPGRNWEQIRTLIAINKLNIKIIGSHAGLETGADGATHQALEDIALTRVLPNMTILSPCDAIEAYKATLESADIKNPVYIRLARPETPIITNKNTPFKIGKASILRQGKDVTLVATGPLVNEAKKATELLSKKNIEVELINLSTIKPLDTKTIIQSVKKTKRLITLEDHQKAGGMGSAIAEILSEKYPTKMIMMGVDDKFGQSGSDKELLEHYHLTSEHIIANIKTILK